MEKIRMNTNEKKTNILIVDDSLTIRKVLEKNIQKIPNINVVTAVNGKDAIYKMQDFKPDLILSDLIMPVIDGYQFCKIVKNSPKYKDIYFIIITSKNELDDKLMGFETGADEYITKPFEIHELIARVKAGIRLKHLLDSLKEKNIQLQKLTDLKNEFLGTAAHDLRNPISVISLTAESIMEFGFENLSEPEIQDFMKGIYSECQHMLNLINDLLDISRIESGKIELKPKKINLNDFIEKTANTCSIIANNKNIEIVNELSKKISFVIIDPDRVSQVINNLLSNAIKFTKSGGKIYVRTILKDKDNVIIEVEDTGQGIPKNELDLLFQPFQQTSTTSTEGEHGTGLGLAIVKRIIALHNGSITVESEVNKGTKFIITLPKELA